MVADLVLRVGSMTIDGTDGIAQFIAFSPSLRKLTIFGGTTNQDAQVRAAVVDRFLAAAAFNGKL